LRIQTRQINTRNCANMQLNYEGLDEKRKKASEK